MNHQIKGRATRRLKIVGGQIKGLLSMIEKDKYCIDIIHQSQAIKQALSGIEDLILENHLKIHAMHQMTHGKETKAIKEIMSIYNVSKRK